MKPSQKNNVEKEFIVKGNEDGIDQEIKVTIKEDGTIFFSDMQQSDGGFVYFYPKEAKKLLKILSKEQYNQGIKKAIEIIDKCESGTNKKEGYDENEIERVKDVLYEIKQKLNQEMK